MNYKTIFAAAFLYAASLSAQPDPDIEQSYSPETEAAKAAEILQAEPNTITVRVKGLICETCGYGISRKLRKVDGIDRKRFDKGMSMDIYTQFLTLARDTEETIDLRAIVKAIQDSGYEPVSVYLLEDGINSDQGYTVLGVDTPLTLAEDALDTEGVQLISLRLEEQTAEPFTVHLSTVH